MIKSLRMQPILNPGFNYKTAAIACIDNYFVEQNKWTEIIPLHKDKKFPLSIREISRKYLGSIQGELLERRQILEIGRLLGYDTQEHDCQNFYDFLRVVEENINESIPLLLCGGVERNSFYGESGDKAIIICGYDLSKETAIILEDNQPPSDVFFASLHERLINLPNERKHEFYYKEQWWWNSTGQLRMRECKETIKPSLGSGFKGKAFTFKPNEDTRKQRRSIIEKSPMLQHNELLMLLRQDLVDSYKENSSTNQEKITLIDTNTKFDSSQELSRLCKIACIKQKSGFFHPKHTTSMGEKLLKLLNSDKYRELRYLMFKDNRLLSYRDLRAKAFNIERNYVNPNIREIGPLYPKKSIIKCHMDIEDFFCVEKMQMTVTELFKYFDTPEFKERLFKILPQKRATDNAIFKKDDSYLEWLLET
ncbi:hypothetical protein EDC55_10164 [Allofrancisella inopinata]|uniref:Uncharacterized protein n=1 Tax=Allofrancisella inopinata TaxID=1085647 RepID=A0AAE6YIU1_9GAMM|nr:hypothetical protein [Allofrancisella inopinata]QIV96247.1 hypothetical protein E4K63_05145 [Allofrancisella inopinata]TDT74520.1 hypothetical protein EDC55_10164 [Allofrancisella inopinata]